MTTFEEQLKNHAADIRLSDAEKAHMRSVLARAMTPLPAAQPSPYSFVLFTRSRFAAATSGLMMAVLLMGGTAYAAEGALPNSPLYPVKIHINESVEAALAPTPAAKAEVQAAFAARRVAEAETLAARGELDATTTEQLRRDFNVHASAALAYADTAEPEDTPAEADAVQEESAPQASPVRTMAVTTSVEVETHSIARSAYTKAVVTDEKNSATTSIRTAKAETLKARLRVSIDAGSAALQKLSSRGEQEKNRLPERTSGKKIPKPVMTASTTVVTTSTTTEASSSPVQATTTNSSEPPATSAAPAQSTPPSSSGSSSGSAVQQVIQSVTPVVPVNIGL